MDLAKLYEFTRINLRKSLGPENELTMRMMLAPEVLRRGIHKAHVSLIAGMEISRLPIGYIAEKAYDNEVPKGGYVRLPWPEDAMDERLDNGLVRLIASGFEHTLSKKAPITNDAPPIPISLNVYATPAEVESFKNQTINKLFVNGGLPFAIDLADRSILVRVCHNLKLQYIKSPDEIPLESDINEDTAQIPLPDRYLEELSSLAVQNIISIHQATPNRIPVAEA